LCVDAGAKLEETRQPTREANEFHLESMKLNGDAIPEPTALVEQLAIPA